MQTLTSPDGTTIAFDQVGSGPPLVIVYGAFGYRAYPMVQELTRQLAETFTVVNYDRRGRGDSTDTQPYTVQREVEDLTALIDHLGGDAAIFGFSSGAALALATAAAGASITALTLYEPPFVVDHSGLVPPPDLTARVEQYVREGKRGKAVGTFMRQYMGLPAPVIALMHLMPVWSKLTEIAHTIPYDLACVGGNASGEPLRPEQWEAVTMPALVMYGDKSQTFFTHGAAATARALPNSQELVLAGANHNMKPAVVVPPITRFLTESVER